MKARKDYFRVIEDHQSPRFEISGQIVERILTYPAVTIEQEFGMIARSNRIFGDTIIG